MSEMTTSELQILNIIVKNKMELGLLKNESDWLTTYHSYGECKRLEPGACESAFSGDTDFDQKCLLRELVQKVFKP